MYADTVIRAGRKKRLNDRRRPACCAQRQPDHDHKGVPMQIAD
jgi:hypothetical protein